MKYKESKDVYPGEYKHIELLKKSLRPSDLLELQAMTGCHEEAIEFSWNTSSYVKSIICDNNFVGMFGVGSVWGRMVGGVWFLATPALDKYYLRFLKHCRYYVEDMNSMYSVLFNYVDARNTTSIKWLRWCGFSFLKLHKQMGVQKLPFYEFARIEKLCVE